MRSGPRPKAKNKIAGLCKGSTTDSDSVCEGSNPSPAAKRKGPGNLGNQGFRGFFVLFGKLTVSGFPGILAVLVVEKWWRKQWKYIESFLLESTPPFFFPEIFFKECLFIISAAGKPPASFSPGPECPSPFCYHAFLLISRMSYSFFSSAGVSSSPTASSTASFRFLSLLKRMVSPFLSLSLLMPFWASYALR